MDTFKTIVEIIIAILVIRYIIQKYNVLGCYREPVQKTRADIDTYKDQEQATLQRLYEIAEHFSQQERKSICRLPWQICPATALISRLWQLPIRN